MVASRPPFPIAYHLSSELLEETATTLLEEGEKALLQGDQKGLDLLEKASRMDPSSPSLHFRQGLALFEYGSYQNCVATLRKAAAKFHLATSLSPNFCEAWHLWASTLMFIAELTGRQQELLDAKAKIEKAALLAVDDSEVYWDGALIHLKLAEASGEIDDYFKAISYFEKSSTKQMPFEFWNEFGRAYLNISASLQDIRPVFKSITCYKQAITLCLTNFEGWLGLGRSLKKLYHHSHENDHYTQACDCFAAASQLKPELAEIWIERIAFMIDNSKQKKEASKLRAAIQKCEQAAALFSASPKTDAYLHLSSYWAIALATLGHLTNRIELIQEAERKIDETLELSDEDDPFLMYLYGRCLYALAHYYQDIDLFFQAIEEFQSSLSIDRTQLECWIWMGKTYAKVYECSDDVNPLEKALHFYSKALQMNNDPHLYIEVAALLIQLGQPSRAITYIEYLLQTYKSIAFDHPEWFYEYGIALDLQGDLTDDPSLFHKALEAFVNVLMFDPAHPTIHHRIGIVYCHLGDSLEDLDYVLRSLHHFKLASRTQEDDETLLMDWGLAWIQFALYGTDETVESIGFREAESKLMQAARLGSQHVFYQLACLYSLQGSFDLSLTYLQKSFAAKILPPLDELMDDEWLEGVRETPRFQEFLALLR